MAGNSSTLRVSNRNISNQLDYIGIDAYSAIRDVVDRLSNSSVVTGGLYRYSTDRNYMGQNISANYDNGIIGRYGYGTHFVHPRIYTNEYAMVRNGRVYQPVLTQDAVGDVYGIDEDRTNAHLHFHTEDDMVILSETLLNDRVRQQNYGEEQMIDRYGQGVTTPSQVMPIQTVFGDRTGVIDTTITNPIRKRFDEMSDIVWYSNFDREREKKFYNIYSTSGNVITDVVTYQGDLKLIFSSEDEKVESSLYSVPDGIVKKGFNAKDFSNINIPEVYTRGTLISRPKISENSHSVQYTMYGEVDTNDVVPSNPREESASDGDSFQRLDTGNASYLLRRTNELFGAGKIGSLINRFHTKPEEAKGNQLISSYSENYGMSRGRNLLRRDGVDMTTGYEDPYCRVWTELKQYAKVSQLMRSDPGFQNLDSVRSENGTTHLNKYSVLMDNGFVKMAPHKDGKYDRKDVKRYMFSIENLAWRKSSEIDKLSTEQKGPNGGRIMWFPPYNLKFTENVNAQWHDNTFIGRGEKIYTYSNTERSGTLSFTLLIDHPSIINQWRNAIGGENVPDKENREQDILRFFAGCGDLVDGQLEPGYMGPIDEQNPDQTPRNAGDGNVNKIQYVIFFPNDLSLTQYNTEAKIGEGIDILEHYEYFSGQTEDISKRDPAYEREILYKRNLENHSLFELNTTEGLEKYKSTVKEALNLDAYDENIRSFEELHYLYKEFTDGCIFDYPTSDYEIYSVDVKGFASSHGYSEVRPGQNESNNDTLCKNRAETILLISKHFSNGLFPSEDNVPVNRLNTVTDGQRAILEVQGLDVNQLNPKIARSAVITFNIGLKEGVKIENFSESASGDTRNISGEIPEANKFVFSGALSNVRTQPLVYTVTENPDNYTKSEMHINEYQYFSEIKVTQPLIYKYLVDKIRFFDPVFHSMTPEGFNSRLNFLHQCTRQGPTYNGRETYNLAFGMQPYCVLRIGDFYNTKICITSLSIDYAADNGIQWDMNREGAGVQPMFANININFNFIGGSDIGGPVAELQNAISENYYANSSVYNDNARKIGVEDKIKD